MKTSWDKVSNWYTGIVGEKGHYFHENVILPVLIPLIPKGSKVLDLACGDGVLERALPKEMAYTGVDLSPSLLAAAKKKAKGKNRVFLKGDITKPLPVEDKDFTHVTILLALQNLADPASALAHAAEHLIPGGKILVVLNHPCFRIPRQSNWGVDKEKKIQYRRMDRYMSPLEIPIQLEPSKGEQSEKTFSFHHPLSTIVNWFSGAGFAIDGMEELVSDKVSEGGAAKMENRAREEFPMFMILSGVKLATKSPASKKTKSQQSPKE